MALKRRSKIDMNVGNASMTDMMFLLLIFLMIATTMVNNNALQVALPSSTSPSHDKPASTITITANSEYLLDNQPIAAGAIAAKLQEKFAGQERPVIFLYADKKAPWEDVVLMMNLARDNNYNLSAATIPEK